MSVQCTQALANNNGKTPLRSKHFTWTVVPHPILPLNNRLRPYGPSDTNLTIIHVSETHTRRSV